jgi:hypothetical protein
MQRFSFETYCNSDTISCDGFISEAENSAYHLLLVETQPVMVIQIPNFCYQFRFQL